MREFDLVSLRLLVTTCELGNISHAAERHALVASAVSKRLAQLEEDMGTRLLERSPRGVKPTAAGETLLEHAREMLASADRAGRDMEAFGSGLRGKVRLLATVSTVAEFLPDDVAAFLQDPAHQAIQIDIKETLSRDIGTGLVAGTAPVGICWDAADLPALRSRPYRQDHLAIVVHPSHPLASLKSCMFVDTLEYEHVGLPAPTAGHAMLAKAAALAGKPLRYRAQLSTFDAVLRVVRANLGIAVAPIEIAAPYASALNVRVVPLDDAWALRRFAIFYRSEEGLTLAARLLVEFLASRAKGDAE